MRLILIAAAALALAAAPASAYKLDDVPCLKTNCALTFIAGPHQATVRQTRESFESGIFLRLHLFVDDRELNIGKTSGCRFARRAPGLGVKVRVNACYFGPDGKFRIYVRAENHDKAAHRIRFRYRVTGGIA